MSCLHTKERVSGNIFIRPSGVLEKGAGAAGHEHNFDHTTIVFSGSIHVHATLPDGTEIDREFHAPDSLLIKAGVRHTITALEDGTVYWCVYSHRDAQGEVVQEFTGHELAYV